MSSFARITPFPVGYFRATSSWLLRHRRTVARRIVTLKAEIKRIGFITVNYVTREEGGNQIATEVRKSVSATPGSTLEKLLRAYIAAGGNPFDISQFAMPDTTTTIGTDLEGTPVTSQRYPHGGAVSPRSASYNDPQAVLSVDEDGNQTVEETGFGAYPGGWPRTARADGPRLDGRTDPTNYRWAEVVATMHGIRGWANQDIRQILTDLEWRIIKQMDLREQLERECDDVLQQAFGGTLNGLPLFDDETMDPDLRMQALVSFMEKMIYHTDASGKVIGYAMHPEAGFLGFVFPDDVSETNRDAKGG